MNNCEHVALRYFNTKVQFKVRYEEQDLDMEVSELCIMVWCKDCDWNVLADVPTQNELSDFFDVDKK